MFGWDANGLSVALIGIGGSLQWTAIGLFVWWLMFHAPLGRRRFVNRVQIAATPEHIWRTYLFTSPPGGWTGELEIEGEQMLERPQRALLSIRPLGSSLPFKTYIDLVTQFDAPLHYRARSQSVDGAAVPAKEAGEIDFRIASGGVASSVVATRITPIRGVYNYLTRRRVFRREMERLRAGCEDRALPRRAAGLGWTYSLILVAVTLAPTLYACAGLSGVIWVTLVSIGVMLEIAILVHEFGHWLAMRWFGHRDATIALIPFFGGAAIGSKPVESRFEGAMISLMGPAFSALALLALTPMFGWGFAVFDDMRLHMHAQQRFAPAQDVLPTLIYGVFGLGALLFAGYSAPINLFNLAPIGNLDGAAVVNALASGRWQRALYRSALGAILVFCASSAFGAAEIGGLGAGLALIWAFSALVGTAPQNEHAPMSLRQRAIVLAILGMTLAVHGSATSWGMARLHMAMEGSPTQSKSAPETDADDDEEDAVTFAQLYPTPSMRFKSRSALP
jgi:Zn-dependent protease